MPDGHTAQVRAATEGFGQEAVQEAGLDAAQEFGHLPNGFRRNQPDLTGSGSSTRSAISSDHPLGRADGCGI